MDRILKPSYYNEFKCIANECEEHCCAGWSVPIDKGTFVKYRKLKNKFGLELNSNMKRNRKNMSDGNYAKIKLDNTNSCPMLDEKGLCNIHKNLGGDYLSHTCRTYPRSTSKYNDLYEQSLTMSCPEVARKVILKKEPISFDYNENDLVDIGKVYYKENINSDKELHNLIWEIRSACISIIQYREVKIWKRLTLVSIMCNKIQSKLNDNLIEDCYGIIDEHKKKILNKDIIDDLDSIESKDKVRMTLATGIIKSRNEMGINNKKFNNLCIEFENVMESKVEDSLETITARYTEIENEYYSNFIHENEYVIENYLVYHIFRNWMNAIQTKDIYKEVVKMVINYSVIRVLLTGSLAYHREKFGEQNLVDVFYSFSRTIEHHHDFLDDTYEDMKRLGYEKLAYLVILIK